MNRKLLKDFQAIVKREFHRLISEKLISEEEAAGSTVAGSTLGTVFGDEFITFELYIPATIPHEAKVIATVKIGLKTREVAVAIPS